MHTQVTDGRHRRSQQSRQRIIDAIIELVGEGVLEPTAEQVSARAGLAMRTVFRHFNDMDSLYREISRGIFAKVQALATSAESYPTWQEALRAAVDRRVRLYEEVMPMRLSADAVRHRSPFLQEEQRGFVRMARDMLRQVLPRPMARDKVLFESLDVLLSFEVWIRLGREQRLGVREARSILHAGVEAIVAGYNNKNTH